MKRLLWIIASALLDELVDWLRGRFRERLERLPSSQSRPQLGAGPVIIDGTCEDEAA